MIETQMEEEFSFVSASIPDLNAKCEVICVGLQFSDCRPLYIAIYDGPQSIEQEELNELAK